jgi:hypothetical protein
VTIPQLTCVPMEQGQRRVKASSAGSAPVEADKEDEERKADMMKKVEELKQNMERKRQARQKYEAYVQSNAGAVGTDYEKWDLWCPEDEEDELVASCTPQNAQLQAMENDIDERHKRCAAACL